MILATFWLWSALWFVAKVVFALVFCGLWLYFWLVVAD